MCCRWTRYSVRNQEEQGKSLERREKGVLIVDDASLAARSEIASMKAWSSLWATASDRRCISVSKPGERASGTQIWVGRGSCRRSRSRRAACLFSHNLV
jgi:hypothetical protein